MCANFAGWRRRNDAIVALVAFCADNWDAVYGAFEVASGAKPLFALPHF